MTPVTDKDLNAKIAAMGSSGESAPLATLTSFEWQEDGKVVKSLVIPEINFVKGKQPTGVVLKEGF